MIKEHPSVCFAIFFAIKHGSHAGANIKMIKEHPSVCLANKIWFTCRWQHLNHQRTSICFFCNQIWMMASSGTQHKVWLDEHLLCVPHCGSGPGWKYCGARFSGGWTTLLDPTIPVQFDNLFHTFPTRLRVKLWRRCLKPNSQPWWTPSRLYYIIVNPWKVLIYRSLFQDAIKCLSEFACNAAFPDTSMEAIRLIRLVGC